MQFQRFGSHYVLRLARDEEVRATITSFVEREGLRGGYFIAFGAFGRVALRYFDTDSKQYQQHEVNQQVEVVSLMGNVARLADGRPKLHIHGIVADPSLRTYSGDLSEGTVRPTLEVFLTDLEGELRRERDPDTGLDMLTLTQA